MREIVIVIPDLYLDPSPEDPWASSTGTRANARESVPAGTRANARESVPAGTRANAREPVPAGIPPGAAALGTMPGFEHAARFGTRRSIAADGGWRPWLARWLGRPDLAPHAPAPIAAAVSPATQAATTSPASGSAACTSATDTGLLTSPGRANATSAAPSTANRPTATTSTPREAGAAAGPSRISLSAVEPQRGYTAWLATPVHLIAGLTNLHFDRRGILRLPSEDLFTFAEDFNRTFGDPDLHLEPLPNGEFLLRGPAAWSAVTTEPARALVSDLETSLPKGNAATALKRLGAELEMWLHSHPLNDARQRRGERTVSTLWLWGGGALESLQPSNAPPTDLACGTDPYLAGLWYLQGAPTHALPDRFGDLLSDPKPERAVLVPEITPLLQTNPNWTVFEALVDLDRLCLSPALAALHARSLETIILIANDLEVRLSPGNRLKFWRRRRPGIAVLQPP